MSDLNLTLLDQIEEEGLQYDAKTAELELAEQKRQAAIQEKDIALDKKAGPPSPEYQSQEMKDQPGKIKEFQNEKLDRALAGPKVESTSDPLEYLQSGGAMGGNPMETMKDFALLGQGLADTAISAASTLIPWLKPADEAWQELSGKAEQDDFEKFVRDASGIVLPTALLGAPLVGGSTAVANHLGFTALTKGMPHVIGKVSLDIGLGAAIDAVADSTEEEGNLSDLLNNAFGVQTPWVYVDGQSPDVTRIKNITESAALAGVVGSIEVALSSNRITRGLPRFLTKIFDAKTKKEITPTEVGGLDRAAKTDEARLEAQTQEGVKRYLADPEGQKGYDAFINEPHEPQSRAVQDFEADPTAFKIDNAQIQANLHTYNGRPRPAVTDHFKNDFIEAPDGTARGKQLDKLAKALGEVSVDTQIGKTRITAEEMDKAVDNLVVSALNAPEDFARQVEGLKRSFDSLLGNEVKTLTTDGFRVATAAYKKFFEMISPDRQRASAVLVSQSAGNVADAASAIELIGAKYDTSRQQELVFDALRILLPEIRTNQYINGYRLNAMKLAKKVEQDPGSKSLAAKWFNQTGEEFEINIKKTKEDTLEFINQMVDISNDNPEYFKPLMREFAKTNGNVDSIDKLAKLAKNRLGITKYIVDRNPEMNSYVVDLIQQTRYNSVLFGMAPLRAFEGAAKALVLKPMTALVGSAANADIEQFKRAMYVYSGIRENISRALKLMGDEYRFAVDNPTASMSRGREDLKVGQLGDRETLDELLPIWMKNKEYGKVALWNITKYFTGVQNHWLPRLGINVMTGIDGFTKSMSASMVARAKAYDELYDKTKGGFSSADADQIARRHYKEAFDSEGVLTDKAAKIAAGEINLNNDVALVSSLETIMQKAPILKSIFMFPRTGLNNLSFVATYSPTGMLGQAVGRSRRLFKAKSQFEIDEVLIEHGYEAGNLEAFRALKAEYKGRQIAGTGIVMGAALLAFEGNLTGSGSMDGSEKTRMRNMGNPEYSIKVGDQWVSYKGWAPFDTLLGLVADITYEGTRIDGGDLTETWYRALVDAVTMNVTSQTFFSAFEPLAKMMSGEPGQLNRFLAMQVDSQLPVSGLRSILNNALVPQLKDVENSFMGYFANRNKFIGPVGQSMYDLVDVYTGEPIRYADPLTATINAINPFFKLNPSMEQWREDLLRTGWDGLQTPRVNPITQEELTKEQLNYISRYMGKQFKLGEKVEALLNRKESWWQNELKDYAKARGLFRSQKEYPIKEMLLYDMLDELHNDAFDAAWADLERNRGDLVTQGVLQNVVKDQISQGKFDEAAATADTRQQKIQSMPNK